MGTAKTHAGGSVAPEASSARVRGEANKDPALPPAPGDPSHPAAVTLSAWAHAHSGLRGDALACLVL